MDLNFENKAKSELDRITLKAEKIELASLDELEAVLQAAKNNKKFSKQKVDEAATINKAGFNILKEQMKLDETASSISFAVDKVLWIPLCKTKLEKLKNRTSQMSIVLFPTKKKAN